MTLKECYTALNGDYEDAVSRLISEQFVKKFVLKFLENKDFDVLCKALDEGNVEEAFRAAHTIKGISQNLSFTKLAQSSSLVTEALRCGDLAAGLTLLNGLRKDYETAVNAIRAFQAGLS